MATKGKWAQGIKPRNFHWVMKDQLAICERPGGYGSNHRRVRRQEEIIWAREQGFTEIVSLIPAPHNLHNYDELEMAWRHRPIGADDDMTELLSKLYPELKGMVSSNAKVLVHQEELGDLICGVMAGYLVWDGLIDSGPRAITIIEQITQRQLGPMGRELVSTALSL